MTAAKINMFLLVFFLPVLLLPVSGAAGDDAGGQCVDMESVYYQTDGGEASEVSRMTWRACTSRTDDIRETVFSTAAGEKMCRVASEPESEEGAGGIEWEELRSGRTVQGTQGVLLVPAYPAPCNVLPGNDPEEAGAVYMEQQAGSRTFRTRYSVRTLEMTWDEAVAAGMARSQMPAQETLKMFLVYDDNGACVLKQLWPSESGDWWLYEETSNRKSWRLF